MLSPGAIEVVEEHPFFVIDLPNTFGFAEGDIPNEIRVKRVKFIRMDECLPCGNRPALIYVEDTS